MPIGVERFDSLNAHISGQNSTVEYVYVLVGAAADAEIHAWVLASTPANHTVPIPGVAALVLVRKGWSAKPLGGGYWEVTVEYGNPDVDTSGGGGGGGGGSDIPDVASLEFDTTGGTAHITQSISTEEVFWLPGKVAPDFKKAIGVNGDQVEGVDITVPQFNLKIRRKWPLNFITTDYLLTLRDLTGSVNSNPWRGFERREVLFLGASGSVRSSDLTWDITYSFAIQKSIWPDDGVFIGDVGPIKKRGWDYLWVRYEDAVDEAAKVVIRKPVAVYVEKVYPERNFAALGV